MLLRKTILGLVLVCISLGPFSASAQVSYYNQSDQVRLSLLVQIKKLLKEVVLLQVQLEKQITVEQKKRSTSKPYLQRTPYKSNFFSFPFESIYYLNKTSLFNFDGIDDVRTNDEQLFNLFMGVVGEKVVKKYVREWRVFNNEENDIGAFVELMSTGPEDWVVGINRATFTSNDERVRHSFSNLFIHEYSHIILYEQHGFEEKYENKFWIKDDYKNKLKVEQAKPSDRFQVMDRFYDSNKNRFVSDYSTVSPKEDMAESFVVFVREGIPTGNTVRDKKVLSFYQEEIFIEVRENIRANLKELGLL
jgi:hypothetical protein